MKPHKHAELIKAWADGAEIEWQTSNGVWVPCLEPTWSYLEGRYRIKKQTKPDVVYYGTFGVSSEFSIDCCFTKHQDKSDQIKLTFDGETGKLKLAEVL